MKPSLTNDWVKDRNHETYVYKNDAYSLNWERNLVKEEGYSKDIYPKINSYSTSQLITQAYSMAKTRLGSLGVFNRTLIINPDENKTDGEKIYVSTKFFDNKSLSNSLKCDVFLGTTIHEAGHVLASDFKYVKMAPDGLFKYILNLLEDEYIERWLGNQFPGTAAYLAQMKCFDLAPESEISMSLNKAQDLLILLFYFIRIPVGVSPSMIAHYEPVLVRMKAIFEKGYPNSSYEVFLAAKLVYDVIVEYLEQEEEEEKENEEELNDSGKSPHSPDNPIIPDHKEEENNSAGLSSELSNDSAGDESTSQEVKDQIASVIIEQIEEDLKKEELEGINTLSKHELEKSNEIEKAYNLDNMLLSELQGDVVLDDKLLITRMSKGDVKLYEKLRDQVKGSAAVISKLINLSQYEKSRVRKGLKSGKLDTNKFVAALSRSSSIYTRTHIKKAKGGVVVILVDESGSMGYSQNKNSKAYKARMTVVLLNEALKQTKTPYFIFGHTADTFHVEGSVGFDTYSSNSKDYDTLLMGYKDIDNESNWEQSSLTHITGRSCNRDGVAIEKTIERVRRKYRVEQILLLVISDGQPSAENYYNGVFHTRSVIKKLENANVKVVGLGMQTNYMKNIYGEFAEFKNLESFTDEMGKLITKKIESWN